MAYIIKPSRILFLHKLKAGISCGSFGLEVAKLADLPEEIIKRAMVLLEKLEQEWYENINGTNELEKAKKIHEEYHEICIKYYYQRNDFIDFLSNNIVASDYLTIEQMVFVNEESWSNYKDCIKNVNTMRETLNIMHGQIIYEPVTIENFKMI